LRNREGLKVAVIVYDMREINIDGSEVQRDVSLSRGEEKLIEMSNGRLLRSRGFFWLASKQQEAGGLMRHGFAGRWWRFVPKEQWPEDAEGVQAIMQNWQEPSGDCRQELVFIGQHIDFAQLNAELDACLLDEPEMAGGVERWRLRADPLGPRHEELT
jgi:G3E family GTPase